MESTSSVGMKITLHVLIWGTMVGGFIMWLTLPDFVRVHLGGAVGSKGLLLIVLILPLGVYLIPGEVPEYHVECEETRLMIEKHKVKNALVQLLTAGVFCVITWGALAMAKWM